MTAILESAETRCAKSIANRIQEIAADVAEERDQEYCTNLAALVIDCGALARQWRAAVRRYTTCMYCEGAVDYREIGKVLTTAVHDTLKVYHDVHKLAENSGCGVPDSDMADLQLAMIEAGNIQKWLSTWPRFDKEQHDTARARIATGDFATDDDILSWTPN